MPQLSGREKAERDRALPDDGNRYELIDGRLLAIEVLSPSTVRYDRQFRRRRYRRAGYRNTGSWMRTRASSGGGARSTCPEIVRQGLLWEPNGESALTPDVAAYFAAVWG